MSHSTLLLPVFLLFFSVSSLFAQADQLNIVPSRVDKDVSVSILDLDFEEISTIVLTNTNQSELQLKWKKELIEQPQGWETLVCSRTPNYTPFRNDATGELTEDQRPFRLAPGEPLEFY